jgi:hypothetical protein
VSSYISKEYTDTEQSLSYCEELVDTVDIPVTLIESMVAEVVHLSSVEQHIMAAIKSNIDFSGLVVLVYVRIKWHFFVIDLKRAGYVFQHKTPRS